MKGICHIWSRGQHFSPSLPGDRYLKLGSKSDHQAEISGNIVRYDALAPRPEVLLSWFLVCACAVFLELNIVPYVLVKHVHLGSSKYLLGSLACGIRLSVCR